ncbi:MAG: NfeD family protein [Akkermansiaceae bacterium]
MSIKKHPSTGYTLPAASSPSLLSILSLCLILTSLLSFSQESATAEPSIPSESVAKKSVYVIPIEGPIDKPNLFILRRGLKEAIENDVDMVILDMDTPGGGVEYCIEMMEMLDKFDGITATYVNPDAISAGSFIAAATQEIYFAPRGKMGASAVILGGGQDVPETARLKIESYLRAHVRSMTEDYPYRSDVIRAMLDADFELKIGDIIIKPAGEVLTLTASQAHDTYGDDSSNLLGSGIYDSIDTLLEARFGTDQFVIKDFEITYSEKFAKWAFVFAPGLIGLGLLLLFLEFKTPGFGIFGIGGLALIAVFFIIQNIAGLAGNEPILFFAIGILLVFIELFFFPGTIIFALSGLVLMLGSVLWSMVDIWPDEGVVISSDALLEPMVTLIYGLTIAFVGILIFSRFFKGSWMEGKMVLVDSVKGSTTAEHEALLPLPGSSGLAITDMFPSGRVEIEGVRYDARSDLGVIDNGSAVQVVAVRDQTLIVEVAE